MTERCVVAVRVHERVVCAQAHPAAAMPVVPGVCAGACRLKALRKRFEPGELERHFFTEFDMTVVAANVPERLQFLVPNRTRLLRETAAMGGKEGEAARETEDDRTDEASWILQRLEFNRNVAYKSDKLTAAIAQVLKFVFDDLLEVGRSVHRRATTVPLPCAGVAVGVASSSLWCRFPLPPRALRAQVPFVWTYRRDHLDVLSLHHLWKILDLDAVYVRIQHTKKCVAVGLGGRLPRVSAAAGRVSRSREHRVAVRTGR